MTNNDLGHDVRESDDSMDRRGLRYNDEVRTLATLVLQMGEKADDLDSLAKT